LIRDKTAKSENSNDKSDIKVKTNREDLEEGEIQGE
jgi:hypothetical protein